MSYASEHPVTCSRREDIGCEASIRGSKHYRMKAQHEGWFSSFRENLAYCPEHVPDWVPAWRDRRQAASG
jgi:hypothetical protein